MAKKRTKDEYAGTKYERQHWRNVNGYQKQVENQLDEAVNDAARIGASLADNVDEDEVFSFDDQSPRVQRQADNIINTLQRNIAAIITNGIATEWQLSVDKNNDMSQDWLIENGNTANALEAFLQRQENGLGLSDRVWKYTGQFKDELELALSLGIKHGVSADQLSRTVRRYLNNPNMLFRRVRNKYGQLVLSQRAAAYHPGRGVYRSSYRNAIRLTGTETNIAYRTSDYNQWQALDFVVGMEVHLSNNHNSKGVPNGEFEDICDQLAGKYPKDFQFTGWHPNCRCYSTAIMKTSAEIAEDTRRIMQGLPPLPPESSVNYVRDVPQGFKDWVEANRDRINGTGSLPYFIRNNQAYVNGILGIGTVPVQGAQPVQGNPLVPGQTNNTTPQTTNGVTLTPEQIANLDAIEKELGIKRGTPMTFSEANELRANPEYKEKLLLDPTGNIIRDGIRYRLNPEYDARYGGNCQSCVVVNELRRRGFDVKTRGFTTGSTEEILSYHSELAWVDENGNTPTSYRVRAASVTDRTLAVQSLENSMSAVGRYHIKFYWKGLGAHIITCEKLADGTFRYYDPQNGHVISDFAQYSQRIIMVPGSTGGYQVLRVDNLNLDPDVVVKIVKK